MISKAWYSVEYWFLIVNEFKNKHHRPLLSTNNPKRHNSNVQSAHNFLINSIIANSITLIVLTISNNMISCECKPRGAEN